MTGEGERGQRGEIGVDSNGREEVKLDVYWWGGGLYFLLKGEATAGDSVF